MWIFPIEFLCKVDFATKRKLRKPNKLPNMEIDLHKDKDKDIQDAEGYLQEDIGLQECKLDYHDIYSCDLDACSDYGPSKPLDAGDGWLIPADLQGTPLWQNQCTITSQPNGESVPQV
ncbi:unnamed protein product [Rhizoctonia solani]|nr:unnamed protein product [Rhizoctonia solani]